MNEIQFILFVACMGACTFLIRASFLAFVGRSQPSKTFTGLLKFIPAAVMAAIAIPTIIFVKSGGFETHDTARLLAGLFAVLVAYLTKSVLWTIAIGMMLLWFFKWFLAFFL